MSRQVTSNLVSRRAGFTSSPSSAPSPPVRSRDERPLPSRGVRSNPATGRSAYNLGFVDWSNEGEFMNEAQETSVLFEREFEAFWRSHGVHIIDASVMHSASASDAAHPSHSDDFEFLSGNESDWSYERLLELDRTIVRNGGVPVTKIKSIVTSFQYTPSSGESSGSECTICLEKFKRSDVLWKIGCNHAYHEECLKGWFKEQHTCPNCRKDVLEGS